LPGEIVAISAGQNRHRDATGIGVTTVTVTVTVSVAVAGAEVVAEAIEKAAARHVTARGVSTATAPPRVLERKTRTKC